MLARLGLYQGTQEHRPAPQPDEEGRKIEKYARQNGFIFPNFRGGNKEYLSCHHLEEEEEEAGALNNNNFLMDGKSGDLTNHFVLCNDLGSSSN